MDRNCPQGSFGNPSYHEVLNHFLVFGENHLRTILVVSAWAEDYKIHYPVGHAQRLGVGDLRRTGPKAGRGEATPPSGETSDKEGCLMAHTTLQSKTAWRRIGQRRSATRAPTQGPRPEPGSRIARPCSLFDGSGIGTKAINFRGTMPRPLRQDVLHHPLIPSGKNSSSRRTNTVQTVV